MRRGLEAEVLADVAAHPCSSTAAIAERLGCEPGLVAAVAGCLERGGRLERSRRRRPLWSVPRRPDPLEGAAGFVFFRQLMQSNTGVL